VARSPLEDIPGRSRRSEILRFGVDETLDAYLPFFSQGVHSSATAMLVRRI
jgi:hypothetical protein